MFGARVIRCTGKRGNVQFGNLEKLSSVFIYRMVNGGGRKGPQARTEMAAASLPRGKKTGPSDVRIERKRGIFIGRSIGSEGGGRSPSSDAFLNQDWKKKKGLKYVLGGESNSTVSMSILGGGKKPTIYGAPSSGECYPGKRKKEGP